jgi:hypothetical protein
MLIAVVYFSKADVKILLYNLLIVSPQKPHKLSDLLSGISP